MAIDFKIYADAGDQDNAMHDFAEAIMNDKEAGYVPLVKPDIKPVFNTLTEKVEYHRIGIMVRETPDPQ